MFHGPGYDLDQQLSQLPNILQLQNIFIFPTTCGTLSIQNDVNIENTQIEKVLMLSSNETSVP